ncbi:MAG: hypothetical protein HY319_15795 [Armatimonadetes bacterium]|nr:hypothetical protein [Armatimonadota bacterium]
MARQKRGNPLLCVRLPQEICEALEARAHELYPEEQFGPGRSGGASLLVRQLIYQYLEIPMPVQYGDKHPERTERRRQREQQSKKPAKRRGGKPRA